MNSENDESNETGSASRTARGRKPRISSTIAAPSKLDQQSCSGPGASRLKASKQISFGAGNSNANLLCNSNVKYRKRKPSEVVGLKASEHTVFLEQYGTLCNFLHKCASVPRNNNQSCGRPIVGRRSLFGTVQRFCKEVSFLAKVL